MTTVIKRGGKRQTFSPSKIKKAIAGALREAHVSKAKRDMIVKEVANEVVKMYGKRKLVKATEIRKAVVAKLGRRSKAAVTAWKRREKKKTKKVKKTANRTVKKKRTTKKKTRKTVHHKRR